MGAGWVTCGDPGWGCPTPVTTASLLRLQRLQSLLTRAACEEANKGAWAALRRAARDDPVWGRRLEDPSWNLERLLQAAQEDHARACAAAREKRR